MPKVHRFALALLLLACAGATRAEQPSGDEPAGPLIIITGRSTAVPGDPAAAPASKAVFAKDIPAVRLALCGVEADAGNADLDAGLIDFKTPDPHAAGRSSDEPPQSGRNVPDYRSSVFLGITLGYHF